jgi:hypothetical protein
MPTKRKPKRDSKRSPPAVKRSRSRRRPRFTEPPPLRQGLLELASDSAQSFLWVGLILAIIVTIVGTAFGIWSLRPVPSYASEGVEAGSPFDVTFRIANTSTWFSLSSLRISCVLTNGGGLEGQSIEANDLRFSAGNTSDLRPGQSATFRCPFRALLGSSGGDDLGIALRSEIYFHSEYGLSVVRSFRITDNNGPFFLNTRLLPPRWTGKPDGYAGQ